MAASLEPDMSQLSKVRVAIMDAKEATLQVLTKGETLSSARHSCATTT